MKRKMALIDYFLLLPCYYSANLNIVMFRMIKLNCIDPKLDQIAVITS